MEHMNAGPHHSKVRVTIALADGVFVAGQEVCGKMNIECRTDNGLGLGVISMELYGTQELASRDHSATSTFLKTRRLFQGPGLPPSNAVQASGTVNNNLPRDYFPARKGQTTFFFRIPLPLSSPAAVDFGSSVARIRYELKANVAVAYKGEKRIVTDTRNIDVVECPVQERDTMDDPRATAIGDGGKVWVQGRIVGGFLIASRTACCELHIKNHSVKKTSNVTITIGRQLHLEHPPNQKHPFQITDTVLTVPYRGNVYSVQPGSEGVANLTFDVPPSARSVKGGAREGGDDEGGRISESLFDIQCFLNVKVGMSVGVKDISFDIPVKIYHPMSFPQFDPAPPDPNLYNPPYVQESLQPPQLPFARPPTAPPSPQFVPYAATPPHTSPYIIPTTHLPASMGAISPISPNYGHHVPPVPVYPDYVSFTPAPVMPTHYQNIPSFHPHALSPPPQEQMYYPPLQAAYPPRPSSAEPRVTQPTLINLPHHTQGYPARSLPQAPNTPSQKVWADVGNTSGTTEPEEGKGERASRISAHLRFTSRNRSVSPRSHRYPVAQTLPPALPEIVHSTNPAPAPTTPQLMPINIPTTPSRPDIPPILSPRPRLSPSHSFTAEDLTRGPGGTARSRSDNVENLERMVDEEESRNQASKKQEKKVEEQKLADITADVKEADKTLPKPPVPSGKPSRPQPEVKSVTDIFSLEPALPVVSETKPVLSRKPVPSSIPRQDVDDSGLDALERRLVRNVESVTVAAPPSRTTDSVSAAKRDRPTPVQPPVPSISPFGRRHQTPSTALALAVSSVPSASENQGKPEEKTPDEPPTKKHRELEAKKMRKTAQGRVEMWLGGVEAVGPEDDVSVVVDAREERKQRRARKDASSKAASTDHRTASPTKERTRRSREVPHDRDRTQTPHSTREQPPKSVQPTTTHVLSSKHPQQSNEDVPSLQLSEKRSSKSLDPKILTPTSPQASTRVEPKLDLSGAVAVASTSGPEPQVSLVPAVDPIIPTPVESSQVTRSPPQPNLQLAAEDSKPLPSNEDSFLPLPAPLLRKFPPTTEQLKNKYDVRSARGGKGGVVTSVAALWANLATETPAAPKPTPIANGRRPQVTKTATPGPSTSGDVRKPVDVARSAAAGIPPRPVVKSASVPAIINATLARPTISSTASLARPSPRVDETATRPAKFTPSIPPLTEARSEGNVNGKSTSVAGPSGEIGFGQAKLKDLIRKYQNG